MISVVCPFYNEADNLKALLPRLEAALHTTRDNWEIIFVDDGSTDGGAEDLKLKAQAQPRLRLIQFEKNCGLSSALYAGFRQAQGEWIATLDADLQNPPEEIPALAGAIKKTGADMVTGIRKTRNDGMVRKISSRVACRVRQAVLKDTIEDIGCSLRIFKKEVLKAFFPYKNMHRFFPAVAERMGFKVVQVYVLHEPRVSGKSKFGIGNRLGAGLWDLASVRWMLSRNISYDIKGGERYGLTK